MSDRIYSPVNPNAQECGKNVLKYLSDISGDMVITGQHTQTMEQEELPEVANPTGSYRREVVYRRIARQIIVPKEEIPWGFCVLVEKK